MFKGSLGQAAAFLGLCACSLALVSGCSDGILEIQSSNNFQSGPPQIQYNWNPAVYTVGTQISFTVPMVSGGGSPTSFSISPVPPAGLTFNSVSGVVSGTPTTALGISNYLVTATNSFGSSNYSLQLEVLANDTGRTWIAGPNLSVAVVSPITIALNNNTALVTGGSSSGGLVTNSYIYSATGGLNATGSLNTARAGSPAVLLNNGQVLIAGGSGATVLSSSEIYNPQTQQFVYTGSMQSTRESHTATLLMDGTVLIAGGANNAGTYLNTAEIYNPSTGVFTQLANTMTSPRASHTATLLQNGTVLITGGCSSAAVCNNGGTTALTTAEIYNPTTQTFTATLGNMTIGRLNHMAFPLPNGDVLIVAGATDGYGYGGITTNVDLYNPGTQTFAATGALPSANPVSFMGGLLPNGKVLIVGGNTTGCAGGTTGAALYDPTANSWAATASATFGTTSAGFAVLTNSSFVMFGGSSTNCTTTQVTSSSIFQ